VFFDYLKAALNIKIKRHHHCGSTEIRRTVVRPLGKYGAMPV
jgi:hypothetical protein